MPYATLAGLNQHILHSVGFLDENSGVCIILIFISLCRVPDRDENHMIVRWSYVGLDPTEGAEIRQLCNVDGRLTQNSSSLLFLVRYL